MATDLEKLIVELSANIRGYEREMNRARGITDKMARGVENRARTMQRTLDSTMKKAGQSLVNPLLAIGGGGLAIRQVQQYADAWTVAGNKIAAAGQIAGRQGRSLEGINEIARRGRGGIEETADLYAKLLRSTAKVANSEEEVARATEIITKAFKAGGAAASEQAAGILQIGQALGSGILQGDELRSIRENAPLLAQAIADEFETTIGGLKALGEAGALTSDRVFKAILKAQTGIEAAFAKTNPTIRDGITAVSNALTQYIGQTDQSLSASQRLVAGLTALADNFDQVADATLAVAGVIAGALLGRSIAGMLAKVPLAAAAVLTLARAMRTASAAGGAMAGIRAGLLGATSAAGPVGLAIGAVAATAVLLASSSESASERTARLKDELRDLGLFADATAPKVDALGNKIDELAPEETRRKLREVGDELKRLQSFGTQSLSAIVPEDLDSASLVDLIQKIKELQGISIFDSIFGTGPTDIDQQVLSQLQAISEQLNAGEIDAQKFSERLNEISNADISPNVEDMVAALRNAAKYQDALIKRQPQLDPTGKITIFGQIQKEIDAIKVEKLDEAREALAELQIASPGGTADFAVTAEAQKLVEQLQAGEAKSEDVIARLQELAGQTVTGPIDALLASIIKAIQSMDALIKKQKELATTSAGAVQEFKGEPSAPGRLSRSFFEGRDLEAAKSELEREIEDLAAKIKKAAEEAGISISEGAAKIRARMEIEAREQAKAIENFDKEQSNLREQKALEDFRKREETGAGSKLEESADQISDAAGEQRSSAQDLAGSATDLDSSAGRHEAAAVDLAGAAGSLETAAGSLAAAAGSFSGALIEPAGSLSTAAGSLAGAAADLSAADVGASGDKLEAVLDRVAQNIVGFESGGDPNAKNPRSTATGLGQFIESTWLRLFRENFPDRAAGLSRGAILALRKDADVSRSMIVAYARDNAVILKQAGVSVNAASLQLAHFLGPGGAAKIFNAPPGTPATQVLPPSVIKANPQLSDKTTDQIIREAAARAGLIDVVSRQAQGTDRVVAASADQAASSQDVARAQQNQVTGADAVTAANQQQAQSGAELAAKLEQAGVKVDKAALDLANTLGPESAAKILKAPPETPVSQILPPQQVQKFPEILGPGVTAEQLIALATATGGLTAEIQRQTQAKQELLSTGQAEIANLELERQSMTLSAFEADKLRFAHEKMNEIRQAGITITPEITAGVNQMATAYATAQQKIRDMSAAQLEAARTAEELRAAQERASAQSSEMAQQFQSAFAGAVKGFISDIIHGKSATEALTNALQRLADQLLDIVLNNLFKGLLSGAAGGAGAGGGLFGGLFHQGARAAGAGGPRRRVAPGAFLAAQRLHSGGLAGFRPGEIPAILKRGEPVGPAAVDAAARRLIAIGGSRLGGGSGAGASPQVNLTTKVVNRFDSGSFLSEALTSPAGEKAILNFVRARPAAFRAAIQG